MKKVCCLILFLFMFIMCSCQNNSSNEQIFNTQIELQQYVDKNDLGSICIYNMRSPFIEMEVSFIKLEGNNIYYYYDYDTEKDTNMYICYDYMKGGSEKLESLKKNNEETISLYIGTDSIYCSRVLSEKSNRINAYKLYWVYQDVLFQAMVPLEIIDVVLPSIQNHRYIDPNYTN